VEQETNNVSKVLKELDKTIQVIGTEKLLEILKYSRLSTTNINETQINRCLEVIKTVCDEFGITVSEFFDNNRKIVRRVTIGVSAYLIQKEMNLSNSDISYILKKSDEAVSLYKQEILRLNPNHPQDIKVLEKIKTISETINKIKND
jgi:phenylacetate-coenzyme A ligase PaaK-like adenylate-forming protein